MGRLIDADKLRYKHILDTVNTTMPQSFPCITKEEINKAPTVEAISKSDYEARLKADMVAMLTEIQLELEELPKARFYKKNEYGDFIGYIDYPAISKDALFLIQQKINALKGDQEGKRRNEYNIV